MDSKHEEDVHNLDLGIGRSYECVFCKRGFNTAQALGGHMNIHRKDRARNKPLAAASSSSTIFNYSNISNNNHIIHPHQFHHHHQQFMIHQIPADPGYPVNPSHQAGFGCDQWSMSLIHHHRVEDDSEKTGRRRGRGGQEEQELDLELRL